MKKIGFIGLGHMGLPMAKNLVKNQYQLNVFDLNPEPLQELKALGAHVAISATDAIQNVDVIISMLPSSPHVESLYSGPDGLLASITGKPLIIDCSTIAPDCARRVSKAAADKGLHMLDAPVSGGVAGAEAGTLTFIVGGNSDEFNSAKPILEAMGSKIFHAGDHGAGQVAKICNNMLLAVHMIGTAEALNLGVENGLDPKVLSDIMVSSSGRNWSLEVYNPYPGVMENVPASKSYDGGFLVDLMHKDLGLAMEAAQSVKASTPMGTLARSLYAMHSQHGHGQLDFSSIQKLFSGE
ncbi:MAG: 3-hydroxyisobutyrate dehydrogenase [Pseudomonadales bacterium]|uniref:3-hydroxyisobutyrate dehydrogenase n=1 Tax=Oleiphilus messinensis TaxID=141451 RepID=A0A1Y0IEF0_9GAMM|nr:3-hydroxyisobutyrate dehydrogenase [Oleiphilus messinensis]ARU58811.1 3-hydroxyisobutyrate dehydrogenase [Oleiphilus messinensis]MCG8609932.1 3-hydroxyisobutyrate dehydrogenase [Pseudomonadales bacterium]